VTGFETTMKLNETRKIAINLAYLKSSARIYTASI